MRRRISYGEVTRNEKDMSCNYQKINGCKERVCPYSDRTQCPLFKQSHLSFLLGSLLPFHYYPSLVHENKDTIFITDDCNLAKSFCTYNALSNNTKVVSLTLDSVVAILQEQYDELGTFPIANVYYFDLKNISDKQFCWIRSFVNILTDRRVNVKIGIYGTLRLSTYLGIPFVSSEIKKPKAPISTKADLISDF